MLSRYSVKRPYTVVVGVILVLILGFVSFNGMQTDLLPDMTLPYAVVYTSYPGASPEQVETAVTRPAEQAMATISNIENIQSVSAENLSIVVLEFAQTTNMDAVSIEIREKLDQISGFWDESVSNPIIMKLNPDMMPIMVAAIEAGEMSSPELTVYVEEHVLPELESIEGVASVTMQGDVKEEVQVVLRQDKIDAVNEKIKSALDSKFSDAADEIADAKQELADGKAELEKGAKTLAEQTAQAESQISAGQAQSISGEAEINTKIAEIDTKLAEMEASEKELDTQMQSLTDAEEQLAALPGQKAEAEALLAQINQGIETLNTAPELLGQLRQLVASGMADDAAKAQLTALETALTALGVNVNGTEKELVDSVETARTTLVIRRTEAEDGIAKLDAAIADTANQQKQIKAGKKQIKAAKKQIASGKKQLQDARTQLVDAKAQIQSGQATVAQAVAMLNAQKISATIEIAAGKAQISAGEQQLEAAEDEMNAQKDMAYDKADVTQIITADMVKGILAAQNFTMPAGYVTEEGIDYLVRVGDKFDDMEGMEDLTLMDLHIEGVDPIKLSDVADVVKTDNSGEVYANINGKAGILFSMQKQSGYSTGEVSDRIKDRFAKLEANDANVNVITLMDQGIYIDLVVDSVLQNMIVGAILAVLILLVFLRSVKPTIVIAFSIPISIMAAIVLMYFSGINLNIISLSGLALGIGMLVDNSIVVIENIYRLRKEGQPVKKAAVEGAKQVAGAIMASTLTTICVFAPIVFTEGITRQLFVDMGLTIGYSLLASLVIALTLVPMMGAGLLKNVNEKPVHWMDALQNAYAKLLAKAVRMRALVLILAVVLLVGSAMAAVSAGTAFMPEMESTQAMVTLKTEKGTLPEETRAVSDEAVARLMEIEGIKEVGAMNAASGMMGGSTDTNSVSMYLILDEEIKKDNDTLTREIYDKTADLECEISVQTQTMDMSALGGAGISVKVKGRDLDTLKKTAEEVAGLVETVPGTTEVSDGIEEKTQEVRVTVDKEKATQYQLTTAQVFQFLQGKLADAKSATTLTTGAEDYGVLVSNDTDKELTRKTLKKLKIKGTDKEGKEVDVPLRDLVTFSEAEGFASINREAQTRYVTVTAQIDDAHNIGLVAAEVEKVLKDYEVPEGCTLEMAGEDETINEAMTQVVKMLLLAIVFMYLIMVAQFQSLLSPFIVMFTIPLAFTGGFLGLWMTGSPVSVIAMLGFVMLSGIIVNNGIVLVDYINQLRRGGMEKREAIVEAGRTRLRPILMTALTTILGLIPMSMSMGMGADMVQPMAVVTIGGLLYGTLLTLFVVPCIYDVLNCKKDITETE